ncbi:MAG: paraquat-inducible protein A [Deltaproteobacteria bacterium]|nr:MAG: paraquat-inducible protein A [Deltaproteobacteria bacterium]
MSAKQLGLVGCHDCHLLSRQQRPASGQAAYCPRCGATLHLRKPNSIARTWALLTAAFIFYIPANVLPITVTSSLGSKQSDTIMSGVIYFLLHGSPEIAVVIFTASIFIPICKLVVMAYLLVSVQRNSRWRPRDRTQLYRVVEGIGRWSMVDIYVVTILVALVKLGFFADIEAGPAALYFAAVVVISMLAAQSFDPRLIWDALEEKHE